MAQSTAKHRAQSFAGSQSYLAQAKLRESLTCQLFLRTDKASADRKKRALKIDRLRLDGGPTETHPGSVWLVAPELSQAQEATFSVADGLSSRGWSVHLVTRTDDLRTGAQNPDVIVHYVRPLESYSQAIAGRGPVICFSLAASASLVASGYKTISFLSCDEDVSDAGDSLYIPDFIVGTGSAGERRVIPADMLDGVLHAQTPALPLFPRMPGVSACLIVRDEEGMVEGCLESLVAFSDEVIVNDTGSGDLTAEAAEAYGAIVLRTEWRDDFSAARNDALAEAKCSHVLAIDADERICPESISDAKLGLLDGNEAWQCQIRNEDNTRVRASYAVRLFRNRLHHRYLGRIHEQIRPTIKGTIGRSPLSIDHLGYAPAISAVRRKRQRNVRLLAKESAEESAISSAYHKYQSAVEMLVAGNYAAATEALTQVLDETGRGSPFRPNVGLHTIEGLLAQNRLSEAYKTAVRLVREYPGFLEAAEMVAEALVEEDPQKAESILALATKAPGGDSLPVSEGAETYRLDTLRARLALVRGRAEDALSHLSGALGAKPDFAPAQQLLVTHWPGEAPRILGELSPGSVRAATLTCLAEQKRDLAADLASSVGDMGAEGEILLSLRDYAGAAERFAATGDHWDGLRAAIIVSCGLTAKALTIPLGHSEFVAKVLAGHACDISELDGVVKTLGFLLEIGAEDKFQSSLGSLLHYGDEGRVLASRVLSERGNLKAAYEHLRKVSDSPDHLALKADVTYRLAKHDDAACYHAALDAIRPLTPDEYIRYIDSLVKCGLVQLAKEATVKSLSRYSDSYGLRRIAGILGVAKREE